MSDNEFKNCPYCDEEIKIKAIKCRYCQSFLGPETKTTKYCNDCNFELDIDTLTCPRCNSSQRSYRTKDSRVETMLSAEWLIGTILLPIVGLIGGIVGLVHQKRDAGSLLILSIVIWIIYTVVILAWLGS